MSSLNPEEFIDSTGTPSIKWGLLFSALIGSWFVGLWNVAISGLINLRDAIGDLLLNLGGAVAVFISEVFGIPIDGIAAAMVETASWLGLFGPLAFPIGIAVTFLMIELVRRGVSRVL